jgi:hypothetical protein
VCFTVNIPTKLKNNKKNPDTSRTHMKKKKKNLLGALSFTELNNGRISLSFVVSILTSSVLSLSLIYFFFLFFQTCQVKLLVHKEMWCLWLLPLLLLLLLLLLNETTSTLAFLFLLGLSAYPILPLN